MNSGDARRVGPPPVEADQGEDPALGFERMVFFSDAVFAIVITLLVLPLTAEINLPDGGHGLATQVLALWPRVLTFVISFLVVGQFWIAHHRNFGLIDRQDRALLWLNLISLLTVAFMPFPAALLGSHSTAHDAFPVVFYAASMTATSMALTVSWLYAVRHGLVRDSLSPARTHEISQRAVISSTVIALSIPAALLGLPVALVFWLVVLPAARSLASRRRRR